MISRMSYVICGWVNIPHIKILDALEDKAKQFKVLKSGDSCLASWWRLTHCVTLRPRALVTLCHKLSKFPAKAPPTQREPKPTPDS